jgi:hypothetical protein
MNYHRLVTCILALSLMATLLTLAQDKPKKPITK